MPTSAGEEDIKPKRAVKKRARSSVVKKTAVKRPRKTATRQAASKKTAATKTTQQTTVEQAKENPALQQTGRKAPTAFSAQKSAKRKQQINVIVVGVILVLGISSSAMVGFTDTGPIDVNQVIEDRNERVRNNTTDGRDVVANSVTVPVQNTNNRNQVDGGLVGLGETNPPAESAPSSATATATSTQENPANASSTSPVASSTASSTVANEPDAEAQSESSTTTTQ